MPCSSQGYAEVISVATNEKDKKLLREMRKDLDRATQLLCYMIGEAKLNKQYNDLHTKVKEWSFKHDVNDHERVKESVRWMIENDCMDSAFLIANELLVRAKRVHPVSDYHAEWFYEMAKLGLSEYEQNQEE